MRRGAAHTCTISNTLVLNTLTARALPPPCATRAPIIQFITLSSTSRRSQAAGPGTQTVAVHIARCRLTCSCTDIQIVNDGQEKSPEYAVEVVYESKTEKIVLGQCKAPRISINQLSVVTPSPFHSLFQRI